MRCDTGILRRSFLHRLHFKSTVNDRAIKYINRRFDDECHYSARYRGLVLSPLLSTDVFFKIIFRIVHNYPDRLSADITEFRGIRSVPYFMEVR